jgi:hypothetical protein
MSPQSIAAQILSDPSASYWLKDALKAALNRDAVDALRDAETLALALKDNYQLVTR